MRKGIFIICLISAAMNFYFLFGVEKVQAQRCGVPGTPPCPTRTPTPRRTPNPTRTPPKTGPTPVSTPKQPPPPTKASLSIYSAPGSTIMLNGKVWGKVGDDGSFYKSDLKPGKYAFRITLSGHNPATQTITLKAGSNESVQMPLEALKGSLNITTDVEGATIVIEGFNPFQDKVVSLPINAGDYQITVSKKGYKRSSQSENIAPGQTKNIRIRLEKITVQELLAEAQQSYSSRNHQNVITLCEQALELEPNNARAHFFIGLSLYVLKDYKRSIDHLVPAISSGGVLRLPFGHRRRQLFHEWLEFGELELTQTTLAFKAKDNKTAETSVTKPLDIKVDYSKITKLRTENKGYKESWRLSIDVLLPKKKGKEDENNFEFYSPSAVVIAEPIPDSKNPTYKILCEKCEAEIKFIYDLITVISGRQFK